MSDNYLLKADYRETEQNDDDSYTAMASLARELLSGPPSDTGNQCRVAKPSAVSENESLEEMLNRMHTTETLRSLFAEHASGSGGRRTTPLVETCEVQKTATANSVESQLPPARPREGLLPPASPLSSSAEVNRAPQARVAQQSANLDELQLPPVGSRREERQLPQAEKAAAQVRKLYEDNGYKRLELGQEILLPTGDTLTDKDLKMPNGDRIALFAQAHSIEVNGKVRMLTDASGQTSMTYPNGDHISVYRDKIVAINRNGYFIVFDEKDKGAAYVLKLKKE